MKTDAAGVMALPGGLLVLFQLISRAEVTGAMRTINHALQTVQRCARFSTFGRLFPLWHVIHIPFVWMLVITAIVHVVAVHAY